MATRRSRSKRGGEKLTKGWFRRCVESVYRDGGAYDPEAVCGALLKRKKAAGYVPARERKARRAKRRK